MSAIIEIVMSNIKGSGVFFRCVIFDFVSLCNNIVESIIISVHESGLFYINTPVT